MQGGVDLICEGIGWAASESTADAAHGFPRLRFWDAFSNMRPPSLMTDERPPCSRRKGKPPDPYRQSDYSCPFLTGNPTPHLHPFSNSPLPPYF